VRSPGPDAVFIQRALDLGADGILVPQIADAATAEAAVKQVLFPPAGTRGSHPFTRAGRYGIPGSSKLTAGYPLASVLVENTRAYAELDRILAIPGLDMIYLGIYDYSVALGIPGKVDDPRIDAFVADCTRRARAAGRHVGAIVKDRAGMRTLLDQGVDMLVYMCDTWVVQTAVRAAVAEFAAARG
jgi:4-hydroxy-2-oxoheptanedioate aldolase